MPRDLIGDAFPGIFQRALLVGSLLLTLGVVEEAGRHGAPGRRATRRYNLLIWALGEIAGVVVVVGLLALLPRPDPEPAGGFLARTGQVALCLLAGDFLFYWYHRAQHRFHVLWAIHELHHSDVAFNATTAVRSHWLERPLQALLIGYPLSWAVGLDPGGAVAVSLLLAGWLIFTHADLRWHLGPLTPVLAGPQLHRIHHSVLAEHQGKNLAQFFPVIDILFCTYYAPARDEFPPTGVEGCTGAPTLVEAAIKPFRSWWRRGEHSERD